MSVELSVIEKLMTKLTETFSKAMEKQTETLKAVIEKRLDVAEHEIFGLKEELDNLKKENTALRSQLSAQSSSIERLIRKTGANSGAIIAAKQERLRNDLVAISASEVDPLKPTDDLLLRPKSSKKLANGKFLFNYSFKSFNDKLHFLKKKKEFKEKNISIFGPICQELNHLLSQAKELQESGRITKAWIYKDQLFVQIYNGDKMRLRSEYDINFLKE